MEISYRMLGEIGIGGQKVDKKGGNYFTQTDPKNTSPHAPSKPSSLLDQYSSGNPGQGLLILHPIKPTPLLLQNPSPSRLDQTGRNQKQPLPNGLHHPFNFLLMQNPFFKKIHQIVPQHQKLKIRIIAGILMRNHLVQPKTINPLFNKILTASPLIVKPPHLLRNQRTIGYDDLVIIKNFFHRQKLQLLLGKLSPLYSLPNHHQPQKNSFLQHILQFANGNAPTTFRPSKKRLMVDCTGKETSPAIF